MSFRLFIYFERLNSITPNICLQLSEFNGERLVFVKPLFSGYIICCTTVEQPIAPLTTKRQDVLSRELVADVEEIVICKMPSRRQEFMQEEDMRRELHLSSEVHDVERTA